ncbi:MAG TPA: hypothetical protein VFL17_12335 [Anaerolineae bacterium]|nr:hypothetical protein [Anaerolineae bacterium]
MTTNDRDERLHPRALPQANWHTLAEFTARTTRDSERQMVRELSLPPEFVERIKTAVAHAMLHAIRRDTDQWPGASVGIRILISAAAPPAGSEPRHKNQGWGFFLISRVSDGPQTEPASARPAIELYLYPEGNAREK